MVSHIWPRVRGSRPVVGSSRKISGGRAIRLAARSSRRRMPPENCEICLSPASSRPNRPSSSSAVERDLLLVDAEQPAEQVEVLAGGEVLVDRGVLPGHADQLAHHVRVLLHVDAEDLRAAAVHGQQGREHLEHRGLAGAVGSEDAEDLAAAYLQVDPVDGPQVAEGLHEAVGRNCQLGRGGGVRVHDHDCEGRGFQRAFTPVSRPAARFHSSLDVAQRLIPLSTASCSIASSSAWEISRLSSTARLSSSCSTLLAPISTEVTRSSRSTHASASWASDWPRRLGDLVRAAGCVPSASSVSSDGSSDLPCAARESSGMPSR